MDGADIQHRQPLSHVIGQRVHPLTAQADTSEIAKQRLRLVIGHFGHQLGGRLLHIELCAPWRQPQCLIEGIDAAAARATIEIRPLNLHRPHHRLDGTRDGSPSLSRADHTGDSESAGGWIPHDGRAQLSSQSGRR